MTKLQIIDRLYKAGYITIEEVLELSKSEKEFIITPAPATSPISVPVPNSLPWTIPAPLTPCDPNPIAFKSAILW